MNKQDVDAAIKQYESICNHLNETYGNAPTNEKTAITALKFMGLMMKEYEIRQKDVLLASDFERMYEKVMKEVQSE